MGYNTPKQTVSQFQLKGRYARQYLSFAGKSSKDFLLYLSGPGVYDSPAADVESTSVPGRNGDIITENARTGRRRYQNVDIKYKAFFFNGLPAKTAAVKAWLLSPIGYQKLQDTYDPDFFRMAVCKDALEFDITAQKAAEMELTFNCKPQRWSVDGQRSIRLESRSTLKNPFAFPAQPIFKVYGDSSGELYVGEEKITIHSIKDYVLLNCETHNAYPKNCLRNWTDGMEMSRHSRKHCKRNWMRDTAWQRSCRKMSKKSWIKSISRVSQYRKPHQRSRGTMHCGSIRRICG